jgi:hypothetical protein
MITVRRSQRAFFLLRRVTIEVDGRVAARLWRRASDQLDLPAGNHIVRARLDFLRSAPVLLDLPGDDGATLELNTFAQGRFLDLRRT